MIINSLTTMMIALVEFVQTVMRPAMSISILTLFVPTFAITRFTVSMMLLSSRMNGIESTLF